MFDCAPAKKHTEKINFDVPVNACDSHCHIFGPASRFPFDVNRSYTPPDAGYDDLNAKQANLGLRRAVLVQPNCHGYDMSAVTDAISRSHGQYRGVALLPAQVSRAQLQQLDRDGIRGVRYNFVSHLAGATINDVSAMADMIADLGWHICIHADEISLLQLLPNLKNLPVPFIIDHMGRIDIDKGLHSEAFEALLQLRDCSQAWIKVSGVDRLAGGVAPYTAGHAFMKAIIDIMPDRTLWGTDWPHPNVTGEVPDDGQLLNIFGAVCEDAALRKKILVDNPQQLYRFNDNQTTGATA
ncbi:amidohydrolase family protein [Advenella mimigardefordensis]|uniref:Putative amidohydrolase 2 n=1 Tax=Advenella mimigardefordensis (strain DSM 17166 / LMG 22922 / DPN7) TaxID=1247726 RepID=W0PA53_ADVMD|nr:amidohydrolase family protein [Advenella mimigardefordensis]AHG63704.1 putative amidohydrolase 2 [Advenella mimigardefordensis DPN7]